MAAGPSAIKYRDMLAIGKVPSFKNAGHVKYILRALRALKADELQGDVAFKVLAKALEAYDKLRWSHLVGQFGSQVKVYSVV
jgi:hypothetical protein